MASIRLRLFGISISLCVTGLLTGCGAIGGAMAVNALSGAFAGAALGSPFPRKPKPAEVHCVADDSMRITYGTKGSSASYDEAMRIISEHCEYGHIETHRTHYANSAAVYFACLGADGGAPESPTCGYVETEDEPVGFGDYDPGINEG